MSDPMSLGVLAWHRRVCAAGLLGAGFAISPAGAADAPPAQGTAPKAALAAPAATPAPLKPGAQGKSGWGALSPSQQASLAPLAGTWNTLSAAHQRKWLALSQNFSRLSSAEQEVLHSRMREWAGLSTRQRAQARLNFGEAKQLSANDKKAMWEAYQALPPAEKKKLAAGAQPRPPTTAAAVKPVARQKLATLPPGAPDARSPRIAAGPGTEAAAQDAAPGRAGALLPQQAH